MTNISKNAAVLNWEPSPSDGGAPISHYVVEKRDASRTNWIGVGRVPADKTTFTVPKLWEGCDYLFRVAAENAVGASDYTELQKPVTARLPFSKCSVLMVNT